MIYTRNWLNMKNVKSSFKARKIEFLIWKLKFNNFKIKRSGIGSLSWEKGEKLRMKKLSYRRELTAKVDLTGPKLFLKQGKMKI